MLFEQIYYASEEYGQDSIVTCGGYYLMADVFFRQGKMDIVDPLYTEVKWTRFFNKQHFTFKTFV